MTTVDWATKINPPIPENEDERLEALSQYESLEIDPEQEEAFDRLAKLAAQICDVPIVFINLVGQDKQFNKACFGFQGGTERRDTSFCQFTIMQDGIYEIHDAKNHKLFHENPYVLGDFNLGYYAGIPLKSPQGFNIGTLCLIDHEPNALTKSQKQALVVLSDEIISRFELNLARAELEKLNKEKDGLIKIIGHDMRNPLMGIIGASEYLSQEATDEEHIHVLKMIEDAGESMLGIVNVLLNSEYIRNEAFTITKKKHDIVKITEDVIMLHKPFALLKNQNLNVDLPESLIVNIDAEKWKQIVGNLLSNAIKFTQVEGEVGLKISYIDDKKPSILLTITDTGIGIPEENIPQLFSGKKEIRKKGTRGEETSGIGMQLIKKHVDLHLGDIQVHSVLGEGTEFQVKIPV